MNSTPTKIEVDEAIERPDSIWLSLNTDPNGDKVKRVIVDWDEVNEIKGDYKDVNSLIIVGIPLYGKGRDAEDILTLATQYVFNQIEIFKRKEQNKELFGSIGVE